MDFKPAAQASTPYSRLEWSTELQETLSPGRSATLRTNPTIDVTQQKKGTLGWVPRSRTPCLHSEAPIPHDTDHSPLLVQPLFIPQGDVGSTTPEAVALEVRGGILYYN